MGRKPNPVIGEYFTRGPKLADSSNRYPHTCKLCGENFPKGRGEVLHKHITEKCPAITPEERINAALGFAGLHSGSSAPRSMNLTVNQLDPAAAEVAPEAPENWSALRTLAEASRQVGENEMGAPSVPGRDLSESAVRQLGIGFEVQEQFTLENPPVSYDNRPGRERKESTSNDSTNPLSYLTTEEKMEHLQAATQQQNNTALDSSDLSVAAAATARLTDSLMDPQLATEHPEPQVLSPVMSPTEACKPEAPGNSVPVTNTPGPAMPQQLQQPQQQQSQQPQQPWGEMTYMTTNHNPAVATHVAPIAPPNRGGTRMPIGNGTQSEHKRKAYNPVRRKEVQAARKKGACIRCRILRKTCGTNDPCDQCRKIQGPRHWTYPCVRTRLNQELTLYSAALIVVLAQTRVKHARQNYQLLSNGTSLVVSLWEDSPSLTLAALVTPRPQQPVAEESEQTNGDAKPVYQVVMIDQDKEDLPARMEEFLKSILPTLIQREPSHFMQVVLEAAQKFPQERTTGKNLKLAIELWGLIEILDRERGWYIAEEREGVVSPRGPEEFAGSDDQDIYNLITFQLSAATERKANNVSNKLISELQRCLENGKARINFDVYLSILILLHCLEKTTWTFKVWEMDDFRQRWPLDRPPAMYVNQGREIADLLKMLLTLRKSHPKTFRTLDGRLSVIDVGDSDFAMMAEFFEALNLDYDDVVQKLETCAFSPETSRSLELHFCSQVLLPPKEGDHGHHVAAASSSGHSTPPPPPPGPGPDNGPTSLASPPPPSQQLPPSMS
ncbi:satratoxin biosynthesis SC3 cluster transcription factor SAT20 [Colletotrichum spaethianum]|uniref:Satratoxin biosynthesis SC3 cluster transcription factor SAT20 n=1 Tax=Colletotrichum spaethianum TaxID=700344 RepID=A0AA37P7T4_9PEZI|nr:satratoxin biosynthesis SC3 cluster transcription factor SAT20 [Colletotrichum spaethianum]GKT45574.1 satratoxin biosynthesis SC3 cluster transcription factor SAT20 [Colletotrichum spaethianum]